MGKSKKGRKPAVGSVQTPPQSQTNGGLPFFIIGGLLLLLLGVGGVAQRLYSPKLPEIIRTPSDIQPPFGIEQNGQSLVMEHLMGYSPIAVELGPADGERVSFNDDIVYRKVRAMVDMLSGPYREEWDKYLQQTTLAANDPQRNFFVMVAGPDYAGITSHPQAGDAAATFYAANRGRYLEVWIDGYMLAGWEYMSKEDKEFTASSLLHEFRHLNDLLRHPDLYDMEIRGHVSASVPRFLLWGKAKQKNSIEIEEGWEALVMKEMLAYDDQFTWIQANCPALAKQIGERKTPEIQPIWLAWKTGDTLKFAQAVAEGYRLNMGLQNVPDDLWKIVKGDITKWAVGDIKKYQQPVHSTATHK